MKEMNEKSSSRLPPSANSSDPMTFVYELSIMPHIIHVNGSCDYCLRLEPWRRFWRFSKLNSEHFSVA